MNHRVLVIAAHPDDEVLGMGGTIAKHIYENDEVGVVSMTDGVGARREKSNEKDILDRKAALNAASNILKFKWLENFNFPDNQLDSIPLIELIRSIEYVKKKFKPDIVYTHLPFDLNIDHKIVHQATMTAFRSKPNENCKEILLFEVPSATEYSDELSFNFLPNLYINIDKFWDIKIDALMAYQIELEKYPHPRSIKSIEILNSYRGYSVGLEKAEAFYIQKKIID